MSENASLHRDELEGRVTIAMDDLARLKALREEWRKRLNDRNEARLALDGFAFMHGSASDLAAARDEAREHARSLEHDLNVRFGMVDLLNDAREVFGLRTPEVCPVCEQSLEDCGDVAERVEERISELLDGRFLDLDSAQAEAARRVAELDECLAMHERMAKVVAESELDVARLRGRVGREVGVEFLFDSVVGQGLEEAIQKKAAERYALGRELDALVAVDASHGR